MTDTIPPITSLPTYDILLNASSLKVSNCQRRYNNVVVVGLQSTEMVEALNFGKAIHRFAEMRVRGSEVTTAVQGAMGTYVGTDTAVLAKVCMAMPDNLVVPYKEPDGRQYLELKFRVYWKTVAYAGAQYNIYVCGTFDAVTMFADGAIQIVDYKTTRKWKRADVFAGYRVSVQMAFYLWAAYRFGHSIFDVSVGNATTRANVFLRICAVMISANPPVWVMGSPIQMSAAALDIFEEYLNAHIAQVILPAWADPQPTGMLNDTCSRGEQSGAVCEFAGMCFAQNDLEYEQARGNFKVAKYDPATF